MQTYFDFLSQHMFWVHRLQHLVLHHIAPFLLALATPSRVLTSGVPPAWRARGVRLLSPLRRLKRLVVWIQGPVFAPLLFVGLIYGWLIPHVHFMAMLDANLYRIMNWSMLIDGIFFWWLMLTPRHLQGIAPMGYPVRILLLVIVTLLQIFLGAHIFLHRTLLFDVYGICGRAWAISPLVDQQIGGLLTWVPPAMMCGVALLLVLRLLLHDQEPHASAAPHGLLAETTGNS
jgi:putative membrane protein